MKRDDWRRDWPLLIFLTPLILFGLALIVAAPLFLWELVTTHFEEVLAFLVGALLGYQVGHTRGWRLARRGAVTAEEIEERREAAQRRAEDRRRDARHEEDAVARAQKERRLRTPEEPSDEAEARRWKDWIDRQ